MPEHDMRNIEGLQVLLCCAGGGLENMAHALTKEAVEAGPNTLSRVCKFWAACVAAASTALISSLLLPPLPVPDSVGAWAGLGAAGGGGLGLRTFPSVDSIALATM